MTSTQKNAARAAITAAATFAAAILLFLCTGCSHNQGALISGKAFIIGGQGIQYYNGTILLDNSRENSQWKVEVTDNDAIPTTSASATTEGEGSTQTATANGIKSIERTVQKQISGYLVELASKDPVAARKYLEATASKDETEPQPQPEPTLEREQIQTFVKENTSTSTDAKREERSKIVDESNSEQKTDEEKKD